VNIFKSDLEKREGQHTEATARLSGAENAFADEKAKLGALDEPDEREAQRERVRAAETAVTRAKERVQDTSSALAAAKKSKASAELRAKLEDLAKRGDPAKVAAKARAETERATALVKEAIARLATAQAIVADQRELAKASRHLGGDLAEVDSLHAVGGVIAAVLAANPGYVAKRLDLARWAAGGIWNGLPALLASRGEARPVTSATQPDLDVVRAEELQARLDDPTLDVEAFGHQLFAAWRNRHDQVRANLAAAEAERRRAAPAQEPNAELRRIFGSTFAGEDAPGPTAG
jgi:hypothetical protein